MTKIRRSPLFRSLRRAPKPAGVKRCIRRRSKTGSSWRFTFHFLRGIQMRQIGLRLREPAPIHDDFEIQNSPGPSAGTGTPNLWVPKPTSSFRRVSKPSNPRNSLSLEPRLRLTIFTTWHDRKMNLLNPAVYALIKVQDIVDRLLHENLGGDLAVDRTTIRLTLR